MAYGMKKTTKASKLTYSKNMTKPKIKTMGKYSSGGESPYYTGESPAKISRKPSETNDVSFISTKDMVTPYDGAVQIESDFNQTGENEATYETRDSMYSSFGGLSQNLSDGSVSQTTKANRNRFGVIMSSPETVAAGPEPYVVPNVKHVFASRKYIEVVDTAINQLRQVSKAILAPKEAPIIETVQCYPGFGTLDGQYSDGYRIQVLPEIGEPSLQIAANETIVLMSRAFNYRNENNTRIRGGLTFTWKFNADGIGKARDQVVSTGPVLRIQNAQLQHRGRYHLEVSNEKGTRTSKSYFINVLGGLLKELEPQTIGGDADGTDATVVYVPTGNFIRDERHDANVSRFDPYFDFLPSQGRWVLLNYINGSWVEDTTPGSAVQSIQSAQGDEENPVQRIDGELSAADAVTRTVGGKYSQPAGSSRISFSAPGGISYTFASDSEYFEHRAARGLPQDFSGIDRT
tara:strand:- start:453 stop:1835 length:1383 start_codon:yes stop_codon:yes gene_type:complete